ncbi:MAG TPA: amino acid permease [Planctomycetota bacterium]|jgi:amino acid transporter/nucleotide-binding universal stress UspA family protein|nr:amino acid permease [Planctomycetota bacterium]
MTVPLERPRDVRWFHAAPLLYGDWGTSRLYVLGLAFYFTGYSSFYFLAAMGVLVAAVGWAYTVICRLYPDGGGVYSAAKRISQNLAVVGAFLLAADYVVTAALSTLDAFHYFGFGDAESVRWAILALAVVGALNFFGPRRVGLLALAVALGAISLTLVLMGAALPHLGDAVVQAPSGGLGRSWRSFVDIVLALSGVEAVANMTGIMSPPVARTSRVAIWIVVAEVVVGNLVLGLAMGAIPDLDRVAAEHKGDMLRVLAEYFVGPTYAGAAGFVFGILLLSAANTAIVDLVSVQYLMSRDREMPRALANLNRFGVPRIPLLVATAAPMVVLAVEGDLEHLAALYAIGVVGAITINLGTCVFGKGLRIGRWERGGIALLAAVMAAIEVTVAIEKRNALYFAASVLTIGLTIRAFARRARARVPVPAPAAPVPFVPAAEKVVPAGAPRMLVATRGRSLLPSAIAEAARRGAALYVLFVRELAVSIRDPAARPLTPEEDPEASRVFAEAERLGTEKKVPVVPLYGCTDVPEELILETAASLGVEALMVGTSRRSKLWKLFKGDVLERVTKFLPPGIQLMVVRVGSGGPSVKAPAGAGPPRG